MSGLRLRLGPSARALPDLSLLACLSLLWITGGVQLWVHVAYICVALAALTGAGPVGTMVRTVVVSGVGGAALFRLYAHGGVPRGDLIEVPLLAVLAILFAAFAGQRMRSERNVIRDSTRLARIVDRIPLATIAFDQDARVVTWNSSAAQLFGWHPDEVIGRINPIVPDADRAASDALFARIRAGERLSGVEVTRQARDGSTLELALYSAPLGADGTLVLYDDIGERKRLERERDEAEGRYRELIESLPLVTYVDEVDADATNVYTSPQIHDLLGWPLEEWQQNPHLFLDLIHPDDADRVMAAVHSANARHTDFDEEYRMRHRDGHDVWVRDRSAIVDGTRPFARGFLLDITQQKRLEEQLLQSQKMDALGQLAGGIAHDFNNLLTGIGGYADLASTAPDNASVVARCLDGIKIAAGEASSLTSRLLAFSRRHVPELRAVDLNSLVVEAAGLLERLVRADVRVELELAEHLPQVDADLAQLKQVVLNLALNARDAMPNGGAITIDTALEAGWVILRVRDTGVGMDAATRSRALEPFFTTKAEGEGTGLGLSVAYGVVDGLGGRLTIDSTVGLGTTIEISLPPAEHEPGTEQPAPEDDVAASTGAGRILVVDDRDVVRNLAHDVLVVSGFAVTAVAGGREALDTVSGGDRFDLLLTDVVMPEMSGADLAHAMRELHPALPVVYMSGYTDDVLGPAELSQPATTFLRKPFRNQDLVQAIRALLDGAPAEAQDSSAKGATVKTSGAQGRGEASAELVVARRDHA